MARGCDHAVHVRIDGRYFIVEYNADGNVLRIKQRRHPDKKVPPVDVSWWTASSHVLGAGDTMPKRVIAAAAAKMASEDAARNATP